MDFNPTGEKIFAIDNLGRCSLVNVDTDLCEFSLRITKKGIMI